MKLVNKANQALHSVVRPSHFGELCLCWFGLPENNVGNWMNECLFDRMSGAPSTLVIQWSTYAYGEDDDCAFVKLMIWF